MEASSSRSRLIAELADALTASLAAGDPISAELVTRDAIEAGLSQGEIDDAMVAPAMRRIGDMWEAGDLTVAEEHLATGICHRVLALQREAFRVARQRTASRVMLAAVEGEQHVLGLEMAVDLLAQAGFDVRSLGADVPTTSLRAVVERHRPDVFGFTLTMSEGAGLLPLAIDEVKRGAPAVQMILGGRGVPDDLLDLDWLTIARGVASVVEDVDALLRRASLN